MTLAVDASVALKWVLDEVDSNSAAALIGGDVLIAPDFLLLECANVLAQKVRARTLTADQAQDRLEGVKAVGVRMIPSSPHVSEAQRVAMILRQSVYDALYLAVAKAEGAVLVTADRRFAEAALAHPVYGSAVRRL